MAKDKLRQPAYEISALNYGSLNFGPSIFKKTSARGVKSLQNALFLPMSTDLASLISTVTVFDVRWESFHPGVRNLATNTRVFVTTHSKHLVILACLILTLYAAAEMCTRPSEPRPRRDVVPSETVAETLKLPRLKSLGSFNVSPRRFPLTYGETHWQWHW